MSPNKCPHGRKPEVEEFVNVNEWKVAYLSEHKSKNDRLYVRGRKAEESPTLHYDEKGKRRLRQWGSLLFISGSDLGGLSVSQNLGSGQKACLDRNILGPGQDLWNRRNDHI
jgi:hypothetical protein